MSNRKPDRTLRIIGGELRRRRITFADLAAIRPTPDRVRETLFNWIAGDVPGSRCLELFAGSGILSMEALSRGADHVTIIDQSTRVIEHIEQQLVSLGVDSARYRLIACDSPTWLKTISSAAPVDLVFLDPPFSLNLLSEICFGLNESGLLARAGMIYVESAEPLELIKLPTTWQVKRQKRAGRVYHALCTCPGSV